MRLLIVGCGAIGQVLAGAAQDMPEVDRFYLTDKNEERAASCARGYSKAGSIMNDEASLAAAMDRVHLVIEAASQEAARSIVPLALAHGRDIMVMSVGAFVDDAFRTRCFDLARARRVRLYIPSGAVSGADGLRSASPGTIETVHLTTTKSPASLAGVPFLEAKGVDVSRLTAPMILFDGPAREAVRLFPKNINVAATVSLLGVGFDRTQVTIVCDPAAKENRHLLVVKGAFGEMRAETNNVPSPSNPATSYLAALSAVAALQRIVRNVWIGI
jgi:aspartate dehydrogenase